MTHWKNPWCWERSRAEGENGIRGREGCTVSPMQWIWTWANSRGVERQGGLVCCSPWGLKELDTPGQLNNNNIQLLGFPDGSDGKESACNAGFDLWVGKIPLEKGRATHSSILAWEIPWTEESGGLQSMGSQRARHDWATLPHFKLTYCYCCEHHTSSIQFL